MISDRRARLLARFRAGSIERVTSIVEILAHAAPLSERQLADLRAPLHTLKGEARMLGLSSLAALVHAIEDRLDDPTMVGADEGLARLRAAVALVRERLDASLVEDRGAEQALARGLALLAGATAELAELEAERATAEPEQPELADEQFELAAEAPLSLVQTRVIDDLCERLEDLRVSLGMLAVRSAERGETAVSLGELEQFRHELAELAELAWGLRLVSLEPALASLSDHARALGVELGKELQVRIDSGGAQLERSLLERLQEPLMHLVHNAIDHGIEGPGERGNKPRRASLEIVARASGAEVEIEVGDDGRGVDVDRVRRRAVERGVLDEVTAAAAELDALLPLLFESGFTTATSVGALSGRGVGLDVVRRAVEGCGGEVGITTEAGRGTRFMVRVPATISRETVVVLAFGRGLWGFPSRRVGPIVRLSDVRGGAAPTILVDGERIPLLSLAGLLGFGESIAETVAICCTHAGRRYALASPAIVGEHELFRRPLGPTLASVSPASASAVMGDGRLVLLLEPGALIGRRHRGRAARFVAPRPAIRRARVLIVDDSPIVRELLEELLSAAGLETVTAADGHDALALLDRANVDLILSDVEMPGLDGFGLLARLRERDPDLPVIMVTTRGSEADRRRAATLGANAYVVKSDFREQSLLDAVGRFVEVRA